MEALLRSTLRVLRGEGHVFVNKTDLISALLRETTPEPNTPEMFFSEARQVMVQYLRTIPDPDPKYYSGVFYERSHGDINFELNFLYAPKDGGIYLDVTDLLHIVRAKNRIALSEVKFKTQEDFENFWVGLHSLEEVFEQIT